MTSTDTLGTNLPLTSTDKPAADASSAKLANIRECFQGLGLDSEANMNRLTALCGQMLEADCAIYNRLEGDLLRSVGQWNTPADYQAVDKAQGHICYDVITEANDDVFFVRKLPQTRYADTDPNVKPYGLMTYIGHAVKCTGNYVGSICAVFQKDYIPTQIDQEVLQIVAAVIGTEEERLRVDRALRDSEKRYRILVENIDRGITLIDADHRIVMTNSPFGKLFRKDAGDFIGRECFREFEKREAVCAHCPGTVAMSTRQPAQAETEGVRDDGSRFSVRIDAYPIMGPEGRASGFIEVVEDITEQQKARELSAALNEINASIHGTLRLDQVLQRVVVEAATAIGSESAGITLFQDGRQVVKYVHNMPQEIVGKSYSADDLRASHLAFNERQPIAVEDCRNDSRANWEFLERFGVRSLLTVPLFSRDQLLGFISFHYHSRSVSFSEAEMDFASKLGTTLSLAMENARLYQAERSIAKTLQKSLLTIPDKVEGIDFGYLYRSATEEALVGGDFWDLFALSHNRVGIIMGDVSGKGIGAATLSSFVKHSIRAYAYQVESPAIVMAMASELVERMADPFTFSTVFFGVLNIRSRKLTYCNAGHPPALLQGKTGTSFLTSDSPALGTFSLGFHDRKAIVGPGDVLLLYTDGLTEVRRGSEVSEDDLALFVEELAGVSAALAPDALLNRVLSFTRSTLSDDTAILAISLQEKH